VFHSSLVREKMCEWNCGPAATWNERTRNGDELHDLDKEADPYEFEISVSHGDSKFFLDTACMIPKPSSPWAPFMRTTHRLSSAHAGQNK